MKESTIHLLPDHVANQIAAGEVVQRPASVVKELMENALDANADDIKLIVKDGGKALVQVVDNGSGMNEIDARMSFERHATSKIAKADDLFHLNTKGFRGEALASIAAVAHVVLKTKQEDADLGTLLKIEGSKVMIQEPIATHKGSSISVKNLFFNIPARRKFLKSIQVEMRHIMDEFYRLAIAYPTISFSLIHNGNIVYQLPKSNLVQRIKNIFGEKIKEKLVPVSEETEYIKISGFIGKPEFAKRKRGEQFFFVNNRFIKSAYLNHALISAYEGLIKPKTYPSYFVFFEIDPKHIDVNIHPTKTEIKFDDEPTVYSILKVAAKHSLGQFNLSPSMDFEAKPELDVPYEYLKKQPVSPKINVNPDFNPFKEDMFASKNKFTPQYYEKQLEHWDALQHETEELASKINPEVAQDKNFFKPDDLQISGYFQLHKKFIVAKLSGELVLIHQNRAHSWVMFNTFLDRVKHGNLASQKLIFPIELSIQKDEINLLKTKKKFLKDMGFELNFTSDAIQIEAIPISQKSLDITTFFQDFIGKLTDDVPMNDSEMYNILVDALAKKAAIKSGQILEQAEMKTLIDDLFQLQDPNFTQDGKRIFVRLNERQISNML